MNSMFTRHKTGTWLVTCLYVTDFVLFMLCKQCNEFHIGYLWGKR